MKFLEGEEFTQAKQFIEEAAKVALQATCSRSKCGAIVVNTKQDIIGRGFNSPPKELDSQCRCANKKAI